MPNRRFTSGPCCGWIALLMLGLAMTGCATQEITTITLSGVVRGGSALVGNVPPEAMQLTRNGTAYQVGPDMPLEPGDALHTGQDTAAVISYPGGARAYIYPDTQVRIGSVIDDLGKVFVKVKGFFQVKTNFVTAGSEGTQYWVDVKPSNEVKVVVVQDVVSLESPNGAWPRRPLKAGEQALFRGAAPSAVGAANPADIRRESDWVESMDRLVPVKTTLSKWAVLIPIAAGIFIVESGKSGSSNPPPPSSPNIRR